MASGQGSERLPLAEASPLSYFLEAACFRWYCCRMLFSLLRRFLVVLLLLTFVGGSWLSAAAQEAPHPCTMAMGGDMAKQAPSDRSMPCEQSVPGCSKQLCCLVGA